MGPTFSVHVTTHDSLAQPDFAAQARKQYKESRTGILTNVGGDVAGKYHCYLSKITG